MQIPAALLGSAVLSLIPALAAQGDGRMALPQDAATARAAAFFTAST
jgi:hypothetical protein